MNDLGGARLLVTINEKGGVAALKCHRKTLEKVLYLKCRVFSPSTSVLARKFLEVLECILVPAAEGLDDERLEVDALGAAIVKVGAIFGRFSRFNGCCWMNGRLKDDCFLSGGGDTDVEGDLPPIHPVFDVDVGRP